MLFRKAKVDNNALKIVNTDIRGDRRAGGIRSIRQQFQVVRTTCDYVPRYHKCGPGNIEGLPTFFCLARNKSIEYSGLFETHSV